MTPPRRPPPPDEPSLGGWSEPGQADPVSAPRRPAGPRYVPGALVGRGGMGLVRAARDTLLGREVALKELAPERADDRVAVARLAREAAITSRLDHPAIVSVYDLGALPDGRPYYTMRLVRGRTLGEAARSPDERRGLVRHVLAAAEALAVAHEVGLVHRDLTPANVLVGPHGETQVIDWGLATPTPAAAARWAGLPASSPRGRVGTEAFMSPEQAQGAPADPRDDVWALGRVLAAVVDAPPPELAAVISRATAPDPQDRYPDAGAFAADLLSWYEGRRVAAYAYSPGDLLRRAAAAYRLPLGVGLVGAVALAVAVGVGWARTSASLARAQAAEAAAGERLAQLQLDRAVDAVEQGDRETAERLALSVLERGEDPLARGVFAAFGRADRPERVRVEAGPTCTWSALPPGSAWVLCGRPGEVLRWEAGRVAWSAPVAAEGGEVLGDRVVLWDRADATIALDARDGAERGRWARTGGDWERVRAPRHVWAGEAPLQAVAGGPSGCLGRIEAAAVTGGQVAALCNDGTLVTGPVAGPLRRLPSAAAGDDIATAVLLGPPGRVLVGTVRGRMLVLSADTGALLEAGDTGLGTIRGLEAAPDGRHVAVDALRGVGLWRLDTATLVTSFPVGHPRAVGLSDAGLVVHDGALRTWRFPTGAPAVVHAGVGLAELAVAPAGDRVAVVGGGGTVRVVDLRDGRRTALALGGEVVKAAAFGPGGLFLSGMDLPRAAIVDEAGTVRALPRPRPLRRVAWLGDGSLVGADLERGVYRWASPGAEPAALLADRTVVDLERDGERVLLLDRDGAVDRLEGDRAVRVAVVAGARAVAARGERLAAAVPDGVWVRGPDGERLLPTPGLLPVDVALSLDGARVAASTLEGRVLVWATADGRLLGVLPGHTERAAAVEFLPDGDLVSASWDKTARVWALGALERPVRALADEVRGAWGEQAM